MNELAGMVATDSRSTATRFDTLDGCMAASDARMDRLEGVMEKILKVIESIDERTKDWADIPERIDKLEDRVLKLEGARQ